MTLTHVLDRQISLTNTLAEFAGALEYDDIPGEVVAAAKRLILDTLAVAWAGTSASGVDAVARLVRSEGGAPESILWGYTKRVPATAAAFANGLASASLDYDSVNGAAHADIIALPAALALAEREHATGRAFVTAFVLGSETICRLTRAASGRKGWSLGSVCGVFGAAIAAAKLLRLDTATTRNALGIALSQAAGTQQANVEQRLTKRLQPALATRGGVFSALLAASGIDAPIHALEGRFGLSALYEPIDGAVLLCQLGSRYVLAKTNLKKYPVCACSHAAVEACLSLVNAYDLAPADITGIEATITPFMHRLVGGDFAPATQPQVAAQFSLRYALASIVVRRKLGLSEIEDAAVFDPQIGDLAREIVIRVDADHDGSETPAEVVLHTRQRGTLRARVTDFPGSPAAPLDGAAIQTKLNDCRQRGLRPLSRERLTEIAAAVEAIEGVTDMNSFTQLLAG